jgi:HEAT repeat protein
VQRATYTATSDLNSPSWKIDLDIKNSTEDPLEIGETLLVIETFADTETGAAIDDATFHVRRQRLEDDSNTVSISDRYMSLFGYTVQLNGTAIIPFGALSTLTGNKSSIGLFLAALTSPNIPALPGGGFGNVASGGQATLAAEVITPLMPKKRLGVVVVLPSMTAANAASIRTTRHVWYEYAAHDVKNGETLSGATRHEAPLGSPALAAFVSDAQLPMWRQRLALNWLVEDDPKAAAPVIAEILRSESQRSLFRSAIANAGMLKSADTVAPIAALLSTTSDRGLILLATEALGRIGDPSVAPVIRPKIDDKDSGISRIAMLALGSRRDTASTPHLLRIFDASKAYATASAAAKALVNIGDAASVEHLFETFANPKANEDLRRGVADALSPELAQAHVAKLVAVLLSKNLSYGIASDAAEALGRARNGAALDALRQVVQTGDSQAANFALREMARNEDAAWRNAVIEVASWPTSKLRAQAFNNLALFNVKAGTAAMHEATRASEAEVRKAACTALERLKEATPAPCAGSK